MRESFVYPLALLIALLALTLWIDSAVQLPAPPKPPTTYEVDYMVKNFVTYSTDIKGRLRYQLHAKELRHFLHNQNTVLLAPRYILFSRDKPYITVESGQGRVSANGDTLVFTERVRLSKHLGHRQAALTLETKQLTVFPNQERMQTDQAVVIHQAPHTVISAQGGMVYEKRKELMRLYRKVRVHYTKPA